MYTLIGVNIVVIRFKCFSNASHSGCVVSVERFIFCLIDLKMVFVQHFLIAASGWFVYFFMISRVCFAFWCLCLGFVCFVWITICPQRGKWDGFECKND